MWRCSVRRLVERIADELAAPLLWPSAQATRTALDTTLLLLADALVTRRSHQSLQVATATDCRCHKATRCQAAGQEMPTMALTTVVTNANNAAKTKARTNVASRTTLMMTAATIEAGTTRMGADVKKTMTQTMTVVTTMTQTMTQTTGAAKTAAALANAAEIVAILLATHPARLATTIRTQAAIADAVADTPATRDPPSRSDVLHRCRRACTSTSRYHDSMARLRTSALASCMHGSTTWKARPRCQSGATPSSSVL